MSSLTHRGELARPADPGRDASLTDRQRREAAYYAEFAARNAPASIDFTPVTSTRRRPWSPFWTVCQAVRDVPDPGDKSLLDLGCGMGGAAVRFAKVGYQRVAGLDVSDANLAVARRLAERYDLGDRCDFAPGVAERLPWPDASFDVVTVIDLLHHVENDRAAAEIHRVLKPGGLLVIKEPVRAPVIERLRDSRLGRWLAPGATSTDPRTDQGEARRTAPKARAIVSRSSSVSAEL